MTRHRHPTFKVGTTYRIVFSLNCESVSLTALIHRAIRHVAKFKRMCELLYSLLPRDHGDDDFVQVRTKRKVTGLRVYLKSWSLFVYETHFFSLTNNHNAYRIFVPWVTFMVGTSVFFLIHILLECVFYTKSKNQGFIQTSV